MQSNTDFNADKAQEKQRKKERERDITNNYNHF